MTNGKIIEFINRDLEAENRRIRIGERYKSSQKLAVTAFLGGVTVFGLFVMWILGGK